MDPDPNFMQEREDSRDQKMVDKKAISVLITSNDGVVDLIRTASGNNVVTVQLQKIRVHIHNGL